MWSKSILITSVSGLRTEGSPLVVSECAEVAVEVANIVVARNVDDAIAIYFLFLALLTLFRLLSSAYYGDFHIGDDYACIRM